MNRCAEQVYNRIGVSVLICFLQVFLQVTASLADPIRIDGHFDDWQSVPGVSNCVSDAMKGVTPWESLKVTDDSTYLYVYLASLAPVTVDANTYIFFNTDRKLSTGFGPRSGADFMFRAGGIYRYTGQGQDWSWEPLNMPPGFCAISGRQLEMRLPRTLLGLEEGAVITLFAWSPYPGLVKVIDGKFDDWEVELAGQPVGRDATNENASVASNRDWESIWASNTDDSLYLLLHLNGRFDTVSNHYDIFLDSDARQETGYVISNSAIGADYLFQNGALYRYRGTGLDWNWQAVNGVTSSIGTSDSSRMEIALDRQTLEWNENRKPIYLFLLSERILQYQGTSEYFPKPGNYLTYSASPTRGVSLPQTPATGWSYGLLTPPAAFPLPPSLHISELMYNPPDGDAYQFVEIQNGDAVPVDLACMSFEGIDFIFKEGTVLAGGERLVICSDIDPPAFAYRYPAVSIAGYFSKKLSKRGERIALLDREGHTIESVTYTSGHGWPIAANGLGFSLERSDPNGDPNDPADWTTSMVPGGTPGKAPVLRPPSAIRFSEIMPVENPIEGGIEATAGWVELFNSGTNRANISGWSLTNDADKPHRFIFPHETQLNPGGYLVLGFGSDSHAAKPHADFVLSNLGGELFLFDELANLSDSLSFGPLPAHYSLARQGNCWQAAQPSPGASNTRANFASPTHLVINEWQAASSPGTSDWVELLNLHPSLPVDLHDLWFFNGAVPFQIKAPLSLEPGGFLRLWADDQPGFDHLGVKLSAGGGCLLVADTNGVLIDRVVYGPQSANLTRGRSPDGTTNIVFLWAGPTPAKPNTSTSTSAPPDLTQLRIAQVDSTSMQLRFHALSNHSYSVLFCDQLDNAHWKSLLDFPPASASRDILLPDPLTKLLVSRYYRLATPTLWEPGKSIVQEPLLSGYTNVPVDSPIDLTFLTPIDPMGINTNSIHILEGTNSVPGKFTFSENFQFLTFQPDLPFNHNTMITICLTNNLRDFQGNSIPISNVWKFTTAAAKDLVDDRSVYLDVITPVDEIHLRVFERPGGYTLNDVLSDVNIWDTNSPTVNVLCQQGDFGFGLSAPNATLAQRGHSAREYEQRSFKIHLLNSASPWRGQRTINLNKHAGDLTRVRQKLSFDLFTITPDMNSLRTSFIRLYINDIDYGLFTQVEDPDGDFLVRHGLTPGDLYKANAFQFFRHGDILRLATDPLYNKRAFEQLLEIGNEHSNHAKLLSMLEAVNDYSQNINTIFERHFNRNNFLSWLASNVLMGNLDTADQNYILYSPNDTSTWYFLPWDYDGCWGFYDQPYPNFRGAGFLGRWQEGLPNWWGSLLVRRFVQDANNLSQLTQRIDYIYHHVITEERIQQLVYSYHDVVEAFISRSPDLEHLPTLKIGNPIDQFTSEYQRLPSTLRENYSSYFATLDRPMPVTLNDPEYSVAGIQFSWKASAMMRWRLRSLRLRRQSGQRGICRSCV